LTSIFAVPNRHLSLVTLIRTDTFESHKGLIEYNVTFYRRAIHKIIEVEEKSRRGAGVPVPIPATAVNMGKGKSGSRYGTF
jgi:hypothetical protein